MSPLKRASRAFASPRIKFSPSRYLTILVLDALIAASALLGAMLIRFEGDVPPLYLSAFVSAAPVVVATRLLTIVVFGLHRWSFRMSGLHEGARLVVANLAGSLILTALAVVITASLPRSVIALEFFLSTTLMASLRFGPRLAWGWYRFGVGSFDDSRTRTLIIGAGSAGDLLIRDLTRDRGNRLHIVGFLDDDHRKVGTSLGGKPVIGKLERIAEVVAEQRVAQVLIAIPRLAPERIRWILGQCATLKVSFKIIPASFAYLNDKLSAAMLHDLSPEDLLPRAPVAFDVNETRRMIGGKRILVTGAAGSIGSEISRQVASHQPASLTLVDINENELYLLQRHLRELHPSLELHAQIADIRDARRLERLGAQFKPQIVFHAAAHKHVPLMEDAPDEAVKNNVFGTLNVARMADSAGVENFVLISTDKAVRPSSVMGATKRIAELLVRDLASKSNTRFTAVRFGNVLGSAGSVVPLFKQQISRGGPVTVTHPDCTRYFMTIPEACGLVVLAGLGGYGELCVLDMGEPIRIAELAANLITMAGLAPGKDIPIVFTGLRPGEKLAEELLTEEEEQTQQVRNRIMVAKSRPPPANLHERLDALRRAADSGDAAVVRAQLRSLVPSYADPTPASPIPGLGAEPSTPPGIKLHVA